MNAKSENISWMGYCNHETWACQMWFKMDKEQYQSIKQYADIRNNLDHKKNVIVEVAAYIKEIVTENCPDLGPNMYRDLLFDSLGHINYDEIAQHIIDD